MSSRMVLFLIALAYTGFLNLTKAQIAVVASAWGILAILTGSTIYSNWELPESESHTFAFIRRLFRKSEEVAAEAWLPTEQEDEREKRANLKKLRERVARLKRFRPFRERKEPIKYKDL